MITIKCMLIEADISTVNGRTYPRSVLENAVKQLNLPIMGGLDIRPEPIRIDKVSHEVRSLYVDFEGRLVGEVEILDTPEGRTLTNMIDESIGPFIGPDKFTLNPCFIGSLDSNNIAGNDLRITAINICLIEDANREILSTRTKKEKEKEKEMKLWSKKTKLTATDDFVNFMLMKLYEEPDEWKLDKYGSNVEWWRYKGVAVYSGFGANLGEIQDGNGAVNISNKQKKLIATVTENMRSAQALRKMMKAAVKNVT